MGYKRLEHLSDFMHYGFMVRVTCRSCGRRQELDPTQLYWLFIQRRWDARLRKAWRRFRCGHCGVKNSAIDSGGYVKE